MTFVYAYTLGQKNYVIKALVQFHLRINFEKSMKAFVFKLRLEVV